MRKRRCLVISNSIFNLLPSESFVAVILSLPIYLQSMQRLEDTSTTAQIIGAIFAYSICSSTLLLANKMAMVYLPLPSVVSFIQIASSAVIVLCEYFSSFSSLFHVSFRSPS